MHEDNSSQRDSVIDRNERPIYYSCSVIQVWNFKVRRHLIRWHKSANDGNGRANSKELLKPLDDLESISSENERFWVIYCYSLL